MRDVIQFIVYTHLFEEDKIRKTEPPLARRTKEESVYLFTFTRNVFFGSTTGI